jgi:tetratricopeptide (TPR) repeat protein
MRRHRRKHINFFRIFIVLGVIGAVLYVNQFVVPTIPPPFISTTTPTRNPESFINQADQMFREGKLVQASKVYQDAIRTDPNNRSIYVSLARVQIFAGQYEDGLKNAELALVGNDGYALAHGVRGWALQFLGRYDEALASLKRALELEPNNPLVQAYFAETLINKGDFGDMQTAIQASREAINLGSDLLESHRIRGYVLFVTGNYEDAIKEFQTALAINSNIPDLHMFMGYCYRAIGDYGNAIQSFLEANALNPSDSVPDLEISRTYATVGEFAKAVQAAQKAVEENPENPHRYGNLGIMLYKNLEYDEAIKNLTIAVRGGTTLKGTTIAGLPLDYGLVAQYYYTYGLALARQNRCNEAVSIMQALLAGVPDDEISVFNANEGLSLCKASLEAGTPTPEITVTPTP